MSKKAKQTVSAKPAKKPASHKLDPANYLSDRLLALLEVLGITVEMPAPDHFVFYAVPVGEDFNKPRTNVLLRAFAWLLGYETYVDVDLSPTGADPMIRKGWRGPAANGWHRILGARMLGLKISEAFCEFIETYLDSPVAKELRRVVDRGKRLDSRTREFGPVLTQSAEMMNNESAAVKPVMPVYVDAARKAFGVIRRRRGPRCLFVWDRSGLGQDSFIAAVAGETVAKADGDIGRGILVRCSAIAVGCISPAELDIALMRLLSEAVCLDNAFFLFKDIDLLLSGSSVCQRLICDAAENGLNFIGTAMTEQRLPVLRRDPALFRSLRAMRLTPPDPNAVGRWLQNMAKTAGIEIERDALKALVQEAMYDDHVDALTATEMLALVMAAVQDDGRQSILMDDISAACSMNSWPDSD